jgi:hypothetical protein
VALLALLPASSQGHGRSSASSSRLHTFEVDLLGRRHAAEHARLRRYLRDPKVRRALRRAHRTALARTAASTESLDQVGRWNGEFDIPVFAINAIMLPTGKVLWFAYPNSPDYGGAKDQSDAWLWDPAKGTGASSFEQVTPPIDPGTGKPVNLFCAGASFTQDGRVVVTGGNLAYPSQTTGGKYAGLDQVYTFDPFSETWVRQPDMNHGRWYPSQLLMPDGRTFIMGGLDEGGYGDKNQDLELFTPSTSPTGVGSISFLGPEGVLGSSGAPPIGDYYPHLFWMPSGHGLIAGPWTVDTWQFDPPGSPAKLSWKNLSNLAYSRVWGTAVPVPAGTDGSHEVMLLGGSDKPAADSAGTDAVATANAAVYDERDPGWDERTTLADGALNVARSHQNTVLLPDGSMATIGGGIGSVVAGTYGPNGSPGQYAADPAQLQMELWDPATRRWRLGPAQNEFRAYHSTAVLLPDGRVVSAGDDFNGRFAAPDPRNQQQDSAEVYEPPYLFDGDSLAPRPVITAAPSEITWWHSFDVAVQRAPGTTRAVGKAVLVAPGAATHAVDMNQRYVPLQVTATSPTSLTFKAPATPDIAAGGWYMLFVLDETGTPSVAKWVHLGGAYSPEPVPTPTPDPTVEPIPTDTPTPSPQPTPTPTPQPPVVEPPVAKLPTAKAKIVRYKGRRRVKITIGRTSRLSVRATVLLRDRRGRTAKRVVLTLRTGRSTVLKKVTVASAVRSVRVSVR